MIAEDYPAFSRLTDSALKNEAMLVCFYFNSRATFLYISYFYLVVNHKTNNFLF